MLKRFQKLLHLFGVDVLVLERHGLYLCWSESPPLLFPFLINLIGDLMVSELLGDLLLQISDLILQLLVCSLLANVLLLVPMKLRMLQLELSLGLCQLLNKLCNLVVSNLAAGVNGSLRLGWKFTRDDCWTILLNETPVGSTHDLNLFQVSLQSTWISRRLSIPSKIVIFVVSNAKLASS